MVLILIQSKALASMAGPTSQKGFENEQVVSNFPPFTCEEIGKVATHEAKEE